jgi:hypothetical protein
MVGRREIETKQPKYRCDQSFGLAQRQAENRRSVSAVVIANAE